MFFDSKFAFRNFVLGSIFTLASVPGARAGDAVIAAGPEPVEYLSVCDAYGNGYFVIPGTETCLKIGGRVRFETQASGSFSSESHVHLFQMSLGEFNAESVSYTEYGPLRTQFVLWSYSADAQGSVDLKAANIQIAGFTLGLADSLYTSFTNYAGDFIDRDYLAFISFGNREINQIQYVFDTGNGFRAGFALQDDIEERAGYTYWGGEPYYYIDNGSRYAPDLVAALGYNGERFSFNMVAGYDESDREGAIKARVDGEFGPLDVFAMAAYSSSGNETNAFAPGDALHAWGDWAAWAGFGYQFDDRLKVNGRIAATESRTISASANLKWYPVENLLIEPEVSVTRWDQDWWHYDWYRAPDKIQWNGIIRVERTF